MKKLLALAALVFCPLIFTQQKESSSPYLRVTSSLVLVDFVAVDKSGRPVTDLRRDEMEISEDGKKQSLESFSSPGASPAVVLGKGPAGRSGKQQPTQTVIVIDSRCIDSNNFVQTVAAIRGFIERHLAANHALMIAEIYRGLRVLSPLTRDKATLLAALNQLKPQSVYNPLDVRRASLGGAEGYLDELQLQVMHLGEGLRTLVHSMAGPGGRKHVVFFSEGYPLNPKKLVETNSAVAVAGARQSAVRQEVSKMIGALKDPGVHNMVRDIVALSNSYGISFYTIDARGLVAIPGLGKASVSGDVATGPGFSGIGTSEYGPTEEILGVFQLVRLNQLDDAQEALTALAGGTNGLALYGTNNLAAVLHYSSLEQDNYYLAGYAPSGKRKAGQFHAISIKTTRPGIVIRGRMGYLEASEGEMRTARLSAALNRPELFRQLVPVLAVEPAKGKTRVVMGVPGDQIQFRQSGEKHEAKLSFQGMIYGADGKPISKSFSIFKGFNVAFTSEQLQGLGNQPLLAQTETELASGQYKLILLVEDHLAGSLGSAVQEFKVP